MWIYRRRLSIHPRENTVSFAGSRLRVAADGRILSPISDELEAKMRRAPHVFAFDPSRKAPEAQPEPLPTAKAVVEKSKPKAAPEPESPSMESDEGAEQKVETPSIKDDNIPSKRKRRSRKSLEG
jgi:hypothetical protein